MLQVSGLVKRFRGGAGFGPVGFSLAVGETLVLLGPSGSGKSTLLRVLAGLEEPEAGVVTWAGESWAKKPAHLRPVSFCAQRPAFYPDLTIEKQLSRLGDVRKACEILRINSILKRYPHELSGGERQRAALARLLIRPAALWLLDEPFSGLDPMFREEFRTDLHLLREVSSATIVLVTHDPTDVSALATRVGVLGDGRLQRFGTPEELSHSPGNRFTAFCLGRMNLVDGLVGGGESSGRIFHSECQSITVPVSGSYPLESSLTLGLRPEDITLASLVSPDRPGTRLTGWSVLFSEPFGSGWLVTVTRGRTRLRVMLASDSPPGIGTSPEWFLPHDKILWLTDDVPNPSERSQAADLKI
ncbi:MAG: ABC transporter ATP-binding protein [Fimbriiglobus sp.]